MFLEQAYTFFFFLVCTFCAGDMLSPVSVVTSLDYNILII